MLCSVGWPVSGSIGLNSSAIGFGKWEAGAKKAGKEVTQLQSSNRKVEEKGKRGNTIASSLVESFLSFLLLSFVKLRSSPKMLAKLVESILIKNMFAFL